MEPCRFLAGQKVTSMAFHTVAERRSISRCKSCCFVVFYDLGILKDIPLALGMRNAAISCHFPTVFLQVKVSPLTFLYVSTP